MRIALWTLGSALAAWLAVQLSAEAWLWFVTGTYPRLLTLAQLPQLFGAPQPWGQIPLGGFPASIPGILVASFCLWHGRR